MLKKRLIATKADINTIKNAKKYAKYRKNPSKTLENTVKTSSEQRKSDKNVVLDILLCFCMVKSSICVGGGEMDSFSAIFIEKCVILFKNVYKW